MTKIVLFFIHGPTSIITRNTIQYIVPVSEKNIIPAVITAYSHRQFGWIFWILICYTLIIVQCEFSEFCSKSISRGKFKKSS